MVYAWKIFKAGDHMFCEAMQIAWLTTKQYILKHLLRNKGFVAFSYTKISTGKVRFAVGSTKQTILKANNALSKNPLYSIPMVGIEGLQRYFDHTINDWRQFSWSNLKSIFYVQ